MSIMLDSRFDLSLLERFRFDFARWQSQAQAVKSGEIAADRILIRGHVAPLSRVPVLKLDGRVEESEYRRAGVEVLRRGEVAVIVLNGGMATRFGGGVKGAVEVLPKLSFLGATIQDLRRVSEVCGAGIPLILMNSFATSSSTQEHLELNQMFGLESSLLWTMDQTISIRLTDSGEPLFDSDGQPQYYAPGHGEFFDVLLDSGLYDRLLHYGVRWLVFRNVDNLGARIDPSIIGFHVLSSHEMTIEVTEKRRSPAGIWDVGGTPLLLDGALRVVEGFRLPPDLDQSSLPDFQTNNMVFSLAALGKRFELRRYPVRRQLDGIPSLAFEAVTCEATSVNREDGSPRFKAGVVRVPRDGPWGRFFPVKSQEDLETMRSELALHAVGDWGMRRNLFRSEG